MGVTVTTTGYKRLLLRYNHGAKVLARHSIVEGDTVEFRPDTASAPRR